MQLRATALVLSARAHGETGSVVRLLTEEYGVVAGYVAGGRGRRLRPVVLPGNRVSAELRSRSDSQLPFARLELETSRAPWDRSLAGRRDDLGLRADGHDSTRA